MIHHSLQYRELNLDSLFISDRHLEHQAVVVEVEGAELRVVNIYIPPTSSCHPDYSPDLTPLFSFTDDTLIVGDFNAHDPAWYSSTSDSRAANRGAKIADECMDSTFQFLNTDSSTRIPSNGPPTSPDLSIASAHLSIGANWEPKTTLNSDHLPILIGLGGWFSVPPADFGPSCYTNYRKADWPSFTNYTEHLYRELPPHPPALRVKKVSGRYSSRDQNTTSLGEKSKISSPASLGKSALSYVKETRSVSRTP